MTLAEAQQDTIDYSRLQSADGLIFQRLTDNNDDLVRKCVMNFHSDAIDADNPSKTFDYMYLRATEEDTLSNHLILTNDGMLIVADDESCLRVAGTRSLADSMEAEATENGETIDIKLYVKGEIAVEGGNATNTIVSDKRFKKNVKPLKNSLDIIRNTNFVEYQYNNASGISSQKTYYGVLAQEMEAVLPGTVMKAEKRASPTDKRLTEFYMFNPNDLIYSGLNAIKELDEENQLLTAKLKEESSKNATLEQRVNELEKVLKTLLIKQNKYNK